MLVHSALCRFLFFRIPVANAKIFRTDCRECRGELVAISLTISLVRHVSLSQIANQKLQPIRIRSMRDHWKENLDTLMLCPSPTTQYQQSRAGFGGVRSAAKKVPEAEARRGEKQCWRTARSSQGGASTWRN
eukprot:scaffold2811_cov102-Cylindrotheca_fusiformis.AAC.7